MEFLPTFHIFIFHLIIQTMPGPSELPSRPTTPEPTDEILDDDMEDVPEYDFDSEDSDHEDEDEISDDELNDVERAWGEFVPKNTNSQQKQIVKLLHLVLRSEMDWYRELNEKYPKVHTHPDVLHMYKMWNVYNVCSFFEVDDFIEYCKLAEFELQYI